MRTFRWCLSLLMLLILRSPVLALELSTFPSKKLLNSNSEIKIDGFQFESPRDANSKALVIPDLKLILDLRNIEKSVVPQGPRTGGGGNSCALAIKTATEQIKNYLNHGEIRKFFSEDQITQLLSAMTSARFYTKAGLTLNGEAKDAINFPEERIIVVESSFCQNGLSSLTAQNLGLIFHEYLGLARIADQKYQISKALFSVYSAESTIQQKAYNDLIKEAQKDLADTKTCFQGAIQKFLKEARENHARGPIPELNYRISLIAQSTIGGSDPHRYATYYTKSGKVVSPDEVGRSAKYLTNQDYTESDFLFVPFVYNFPTGGQDEIPLLIRVTRKEVKSFKMDIATQKISDVKFDVQYTCKPLM